MPFSYVASGLGILSGVTSLFGGDSGSGTGNAQAADPYAANRGSEGELYHSYMMGTKNQSPTQMPGYSQYQSGVLQPGMDATKASMASSGQFNSGAESLALNKQANQGYYGFMTDYLNRLSQNSGAAQNPANAQQVTQAGQQQNLANQQSALGSIGGGIASIYKGIQNNAGSNSTNSQSYDNTTYIDGGTFNPHSGY